MKYQSKLNINQTLDESNQIVFEISNEKIMFNGNHKEVDSVVSSYNFHTHLKNHTFQYLTKQSWVGIPLL